GERHAMQLRLAVVVGEARAVFRGSDARAREGAWRNCATKPEPERATAANQPRRTLLVGVARVTCEPNFADGQAVGPDDTSGSPRRQGKTLGKARGLAIRVCEARRARLAVDAFSDRGVRKDEALTGRCAVRVGLARGVAGRVDPVHARDHG